MYTGGDAGSVQKEKTNMAELHGSSGSSSNLVFYAQSASTRPKLGRWATRKSTRGPASGTEAAGRVVTKTTSAWSKVQNPLSREAKAIIHYHVE